MGQMSSCISERAKAKPSDQDAPSDRPPSGSGHPRRNSGDSCSSHSSERSGHTDERALFHALKNRYQETAEKSANDPGVRTPFSTWRRSGNFEDVTSSKAYDNGKERIEPISEKRDPNTRSDEAIIVEGQSETMSVSTKEQTEQNPEDLVYNFRKALHRHRISEHEKGDSNRLSDAGSDSGRVTAEEDGVAVKLERLKAAKARIDERRNAEKVKSASFATEFKVDSNKLDNENVRTQEIKSEQAITSKSTKLSRQKLVSDDLKAKYTESRKDEREKTPEKGESEKSDPLSKKRSSRRGKHKEHMEYWSKEHDDTDDSKPKTETNNIPSAEEMLLGSTRHSEKSSSLSRKQDVGESPFQFCSDYSSKSAHDSLKASVSPSITRKHDKDITTVTGLELKGKTKTEQDSISTSDDKVNVKTRSSSDNIETRKAEKTKRYKKYVKSKSHELGALTSDKTDETPKIETQDDIAVSDGLDDMSRVERIAKYKEERRKQLAFISSRFSSGGSGEIKELPSLFLAGSPLKENDTPLARSKSLKVESETKTETQNSAISRSKSLKQDKHAEVIDENESYPPVLVSKMSGLKLAEIGSAPQSKESSDSDMQHNKDNVMDKLQALRKLREEHHKKTGMISEELKGKRSSREEQEFDKSSRGSSVESFSSSRTLLADRMFEGKDRQDRTPSRERIRSSSREKNSESWFSFRARDSIPESESDRTTDMSDADSDVHVRVKPRKFYHDKHAKDSENVNKSLFEFSTVYPKRDDSFKDKKEITKDIKPIPEVFNEKGSDSGRESVDSNSRVRRKLPSIEDVLGGKSGDTDSRDRTRDTLSPDQRSVSDTSERHFDLTKDDISHLSAAEIEKRKIANNIQKAKMRFKSDGSDFDASKFEIATSYSNKSSDSVRHKTSSLDRNVKLHDHEGRDKPDNLMVVKEDDIKISTMGLDLAQPTPIQTEPQQKTKERKYGGGGFDLGMAYTPKTNEKPAEETVKAEEVKPDEIVIIEQEPPKLKKEIRKYGGGGLDLATSFSPRPAEVKDEVKSKETETTSVIEEVKHEKPSAISEQTKQVRSEIKYGGDSFSLGTSFMPKKREVTPVRDNIAVKERSAEPVKEAKEEKPKQPREERRYGGGGLDLGTSFAAKKPEKQSVHTSKASDDIPTVEEVKQDVSDTKVSTFILKSAISDEQPLRPEVKDTSASKPPSSPRSDRKKLAEQLYGNVSSTAQPFEFSTVYPKIDTSVVKTDDKSKVERKDIKHLEKVITDSVGFDKSARIETKPENVPKQIIRPISFTQADTTEKTKVRRSSLERKSCLERQHSDISDSGKAKFEKMDLKAQAVSTASGKVVEHPLSPRRQSPVRSDLFKAITSEAKVTEVPSIIGNIKPHAETKQTEINKYNKDIKSHTPVQKPHEIKTETKILEGIEHKEPVISVSKVEMEDDVYDKSAPKFVDLSNVELKSPIRVEEDIKTEPEVPLFLEQKASKISHSESKVNEKTHHERGRKTERGVRPGKVKVEKTVIAQVRNEKILQDSTLDDILNRNVDYLSDMEPPDFSVRGRGSDKKGRPQSIHEPHKTKRAFKKRAAMRRTKSEDRSHHTVASEETMQRLTVTDELKRSFQKVKDSTDKLTVQAVVKQDKQPSKTEDEPTGSSSKVEHTAKGTGSTNFIKTSAPKSGGDTISSKLTTTKTSSIELHQAAPQTAANASVPQTSMTQVRSASGLQSASRLQTSASVESKNFQEGQQPSGDVHERPRPPASISAMLYGDSQGKTPVQENLTTEYSSQMLEPPGGLVSDSSDISERRRYYGTGDSARESETSRITTDSDHSVSSALSEGSRRRRKDKTSMRKSKLNEGQDVPTGNRRRDSEDSTKSSKSGVRRTASSRLARETKEDKQKQNEEVSTAISKLTEATERSSREGSPVVKKSNDLNSPRGIKRRTNFSQLLQKFSASDASSSEKSDTDTQSPRGRKNCLRRQEATAVSSQSSGDDTRRTPERTQSLRLKTSATSSADIDKDSSVQRSASFKSDFMKRRFSPEPEGRRRLPNTPSSEQSDQLSPELAKVLNKRSQIVAKQQEEGEDVERKRIHDGKVAVADRFFSAGNSEVIADSEVLQMLQSRRKETDSSVENSSISEAEQKSQKDILHHTTSGTVIEPSKPSQSAIQSTKTQSQPALKSQSSYESTATILLSPTSSKDKEDAFFSSKTKPQAIGVPKLDLSSIDTSLNVLNTVADDKSDSHDRVSRAVADVNVTSPNEVVQFIKSVEDNVKQSEVKPITLSKIEVKTDTQKPISDQKHGSESDSDYKNSQPSFEKEFRQQNSATTVSTGSIDINNKSEIMRKISTRERTPEIQSARKTGPMKVLSPMQTPTSSTGLKRTESVGRTDSERPKGILKRTPSLKHTGVSVDPELAEVLMSRRTRHDETEDDNGNSKLSAVEEIRRERELLEEKQDDGVADRSVSVAERIFQMTNKIEEAKSCPITPRARSGFTTPKSILLGSGTITPKSQFSFEEGNNKQQSLSGSQLIEKLSSLEDQQSQGVSHKRQKFQQRKRSDARTRTQPVTLQEIQLADSLETVKKFRSKVLNQGSKNTFDVIEKEQQETERAEFPLHFRKEKRPRGDRHKTLPVTAAELSAIPEGQVSETMNTLKKRFESQGTRDSKADSGILSGGSDGENLERDTDSWRSLSVEENITDDDPVKLSVSAKASMFLQMQETLKEKQEKKSASGAKRYIDRKKRERSRTLPITEDEVKLAAEIADEENAKEASENKDVPVPMEEGDAEGESDELSRQSLKDKVKLFTTIEEEKKEAAKKKGVPPPPKRRKGKLASRFATQPVTIEEVEKAAKISPLACTLIKPPDPELLSGFSVKVQRDLMVQHAQQTLSQPNSRSGSRASSRATSISDLTDDYQTTLNTEVNENNSSVHKEETVKPSAFKGKTFTASKSFDESHASHTVEKFTSDLDTKRKSVLKSELEAKLSLQLHHDSRGLLKPNVNVVPTIGDINRVLKKESSLETTYSSSSSSSSEVRSILKKEGSFETRKMESDISLQKSESFKSEFTSCEVVETDETENSDDLLGSSGDNLDSDEGLLDTNASNSLRYDDTPLKRRENKARRRFNRDRKKETERYKTQPAEGTPETTDASRQKKKYVGRHLTQPVTPDEKMEAEIATEMPEITKTGSIQDRLSALKKNGEEEWKKRVGRPLEFESRRSASPDMTPPTVRLRERKQLDTPRPSSIADRLSLLDSSQANWRDRVGETDVKKFTVEHKISASGQSVGESPLVARLKGKTPRRELSRGQATLSTIQSVEEESKEPSNIEVPNISAELESFFGTKEPQQTKNAQLDVSVDDFNDLFLNASDMLETARKAKPKRRYAAKSRNPLKTMSASIEVRSEYTEVITGVADKELKRVKTAQISQNSGFAVEALAGLASKENFSKVELRKTDSFGAGSPCGVYRLEPYLPLMLIHIKGRRKVQCRLVEPRAESINSGDCYALITTDKIIQWHGEFCNVIEKAKAADFCDFVKQKRDLGCKKAHDVMIVEEKQRSPGTRHFWDLLGGQKPYMGGGSTEEDELYENHITETNMIYKLDQNKLVSVDEFWGTQPKYEMLNPYQVFVFDFGSEVYVWQGKSVSPTQRKISVKLAQQVWKQGYDYSQCDINPVSPLRGEEDGGLAAKSEKRPDWALLGKVNQNMETILFREKFADWPDTSRLIKVKSQEEVDTKKVDLADLKAYDAKLMVPVDTAPVSLVLEGSNVGRGNTWAQDMDGFIQDQIIETLKVRVWHVMEYDHYEIEDHSYGQFHEGDTYVIRWQYMITNAGMKNLKGQQSRFSTRGRERCAYFFWQGKTSTVNEKGASALMTVELDEERGPQIRVSEGKEMACFLNCFKGRMIIHIGKREEEDTNSPGPWKMYCLRNEYENEMCLIEVNFEISNLRSVSSCLLLNVQTGQLMVWHGCKSPEHTQILAKKAADNLKERCPLEVGLTTEKIVDISEVHEGKEMTQFWRAMDVRVGDRSEYHSLINNRESFNHTLRLFHMTSVSGLFEVHEILNPSRTPDLPTKFPVLQTDLYKASQPALFLIDNGHEVFLWQGWWPEGDEDQENVHTGSAQTRFTVDRRCAMETTIQYCKEINPDNPPPAFMVYAGLEPLSFTNLFPFWTVEEDAKDINIRDGKAEGELVTVEDLLKKLMKTRYTFAELTESSQPEGVDPLKLETYLSDEEFEKVLHMTREAYDSLPNWKKTKFKQEAGLF